MFSRIGTRLYAALALAVLLTLLSSGVGVYYFEVSGDLNHRLSREAFPAYEGAWQASSVVDRLVSHGEAEFGRLMAGQPVGKAEASAEALVEDLRVALSRPGGLEGLSASADHVLAAGWAVADVLSVLEETGSTLATLGERADVLFDELNTVPASSPDYEMVPVLRSALRAPDRVSLDADWETYSAHVLAEGLSGEIRQLAESSEGVFAVRQAWLTIVERVSDSRTNSRLRLRI